MNPRVECVRSWIAGFLEGDGSIGIYNKGIHVRYVQALKGIENLRYVHKKYPIGTLYSGKGEVYTLTYSGARAVGMLEDLQEHMVLKADQTSCALEFWETKDSSLALKCKRLKKTRSIHGFSTDRPNLDYMGGLFAAEGHVGISRGNSPVLVITQDDQQVLRSLRSFFGMGNVYGTNFMVRKAKECHALATQLYGRSGAKDAQLGYLLDYLDKKNAKNLSHGEAQVFRETLSTLNGGNAVLKPMISPKKAK